MRNKKNKFEKIVIILLMAFLFLVICCIENISALSISPTELRIRNVDHSKDYTFIVLIGNEMEGLVDVEIKASDSGVILSPNKFMLSAGEKRSVRVVLNPKKLDSGKNRILLQPYANSIPTNDKLTIFLNTGNETEIIENDGLSIRTIIEEPEIVRLIIYGLLFLAGLMIILIFIPEIKKNIKSINAKSLKINDKLFYTKIIKKSNNALIRLENAEKRIINIIEKVEKFHTDADDWLRKNTGGKYGLE